MAALAAGAALSALAPDATAYRIGPPAAHTGGFGEPTCATCHFQDGAPIDGAALRIHAPDRYEPGSTYDVRVILTDPAAAAAGFQLSVRFAGGTAAGVQAGTLAAVDSTVRVVTAEDDIQYAAHTAAGTRLHGAGHAAWVVRWRAPAAADAGAVVFHAAGNAANDDDSAFGDRVHVAERRAGRR